MSHDTNDSEETSDDGYSALAIAISAVAGVLAAAGAYLLVKVQGTFAENLYRVQPTVDGRGVGSDWAAGNTDPLLDAMIVLIHAADVVMGVFILAIVFLNWAAFRRLAERMQQPHEVEHRQTAAHGARRDDEPRVSDAGDRRDRRARRDDDVAGGGDDR